MQIEFHYNGESRKSLIHRIFLYINMFPSIIPRIIKHTYLFEYIEMVSSSFSIDNILTEFKLLFDVKKSTIKLEDFELNLVNNDGGFIKLQNTSQLFHGAVIDIQCLNDEGLTNIQNDIENKENNSINDENKNNQNGKLS